MAKRKRRAEPSTNQEPIANATSGADDSQIGAEDSNGEAATSDLRIAVLVDERGACPFESWLYGLHDRAAQARLLLRLVRLARSGNFGDHRERIAGAVSELRLDFGPGYRVYYVRYGDLLVVLLGGGTKDSQVSDIATAVTLWERNREDAERFSREFRPAAG